MEAKITDPKSIVRGNPTTEILENLKAETERELCRLQSFYKGTSGYLGMAIWWKGEAKRFIAKLCLQSEHPVFNWISVYF